MSAKMLQFSVIVSFASALLSLTMGQQHLDDSIDANSCRNASFSAAVQVNDEYIVFFDNLYSRFRWNFHSNAPQVLEGFPRQIVGTNHWNWFQEKTSADGIIGAFSPAPDLVVIVKQPGPRMFEFRLVAFSIQFIREITGNIKQSAVLHVTNYFCLQQRSSYHGTWCQWSCWRRTMNRC